MNPATMLIILAFLLSNNGSGAARAQAVRGEVVDPTGQPIFGASITLTEMTDRSVSIVVYSGESGEYLIDAVPNGAYYIEAGFAGFRNVRYYPVRFRFSDPKKLDFTLPFDWEASRKVDTIASSEAWIVGEILLDGTPLENGKLCLERGGQQFCGETNRLGHYRLVVSPGRYTVVLYTGTTVLFEEMIDVREPVTYENVIPPIRSRK